MPCQDHGYEEQSRRETAARLDKYARMLCEACKIIDKGRNTGEWPKMSKELVDWWEQHQEDDAEAAREKENRRRKEVEKKTALAKLSPRERKLLGINPNIFDDED